MSVVSAEEGDSLVVDIGQRHGSQLCARKHHQSVGVQRHISNQRTVLFHLTTVARVDLNALNTIDRWALQSHAVLRIHGVS